MTDDETELCVYCLDPTYTHDSTGCLVEGCPCGYDGDWHQPLGDEKGDQ